MKQQIKHQQYSVITEESGTARAHVQGVFEDQTNAYEWDQDGRRQLNKPCIRTDSRQSEVRSHKSVKISEQ